MEVIDVYNESFKLPKILEEREKDTRECKDITLWKWTFHQKPFTDSMPSQTHPLLIFIEIEILSDNLHGTIICICGTKTEIQTNGKKVKAQTWLHITSTI